MANEFDFFQFQPETTGNDWAVGSSGAQFRTFGARLSNFGMLALGTRRSNDYTRTIAEFSFQRNPKAELGVGFGVDDAYYDHNPYVWGSTVKKTLDDQGFKMTMSNDGGAQLDPPRMDVSDKKEVEADGLVSFRHVPGEGWSSFGAKGDRAIEFCSNTWLRAE